MSEYQFYEFAAIDEPVTEEEASYPWSVSSRAEVTPWRWRNVYNWGDFHGSVEKMMEFYDAHVYVANWGTFRFVLAFPEDMLSAQDVQSYLVDDWLEVDERTGRTILTWALAAEEPDGDWVEGEGILDRLLSIREELLCGDWRALYLGRLWESARRQGAERVWREAEEKERHRCEREAKRKAHLQALMKRADDAWGEADSLAQHKGKTSYDKAAERVHELRDAYALAGRNGEYQRLLRAFRERHARRPALIRRIAQLQSSREQAGKC